MTNKYLELQELEEFIAFCKAHKIKQKDIARICIEGEDTISIALTKKRFKRTNARLVVAEKRKAIKSEFKKLEF